MKRVLILASLVLALAATNVFADDKPIKASGTLMDVMCGAHATQAEADKHDRACALMANCAASGYGIVIDGKFHKFDAEGSKLAGEIFKSTTKNDHITAAVEGVELNDGSIKVAKLTAE